jgi:hypothetical protein
VVLYINAQRELGLPAGDIAAMQDAMIETLCSKIAHARDVDTTVATQVVQVT